MKTCKTCRVEKDESEFYKHKLTKDGLRPSCKQCGIEATKQWQRDNPAAVNAKAKLQREKYPDREKARRAVNNAVRDGRLLKQPCHCGETKVQAHHEDYSKPLDIEWLCIKHHRKV